MFTTPFDAALPRTLADQALATQRDVINWQIEQSRLVEKQLATLFDTTRASLRLGRDLTANVGRTLVDATLPEAEPAAE